VLPSLSCVATPRDSTYNHGPRWVPLDAAGLATLGTAPSDMRKFNLEKRQAAQAASPEEREIAHYPQAPRMNPAVEPNGLIFNVLS
jgi:hypothetical protein